MNVIRVISSRFVSIGLAACVGALVPGLAAASNGDSAQAYRRGYNLILDEDWQGAVTAFDRLIEAYPASDWVDDATFWRCYAREQLGEPAADLFDCYETLLGKYPSSEWSDDARRALVRLAKKLDREGRPEYREKVRDFGQDEDADRLLAVLVALGEIGDERSVQVILERLDRAEDERLRARIVEALEDVESELAIEKLQELALGDPSEHVRRAALETLGDHDTFDAVPLLREIVQDRSQPIRMRLVALEELGDNEPPGLVHFMQQLALGEDDALALEAIDEIGDFESEESVGILVEILGRTPHIRRRRAAVDSLEDLRFASAVAALAEIARTDPDPRMRREATEALGDMEMPEAREALIELLQSLED